jgi:hypothetical protein
LNAIAPASLNCPFAGHVCYRTDLGDQEKFVQLVGVDQVLVDQKVAFAYMCLPFLGICLAHEFLSRMSLHSFQPLLQLRETKETAIEMKYVAKK